MVFDKKPVYFSKSNLMLGLNCQKALHLAIHQPKLKAKPDLAQQQIFDQGNEVGAKAREYFDQEGAIIHAKPWEYPQSLASTKKAMDSGAQTIFEAAFSDGVLYSRVDILHRKGGEWHLIEVKAGNSVKDEHLRDVAVQALTLRRAGMSVATYSIMHLNRDCFYPDLSDLFVIQEVTAEVLEQLPAIETQIDELLSMSRGPKPKKQIGRHCTEPYECPFKAHCWAAIPDYSVFELPRMDADRAATFLEEGKALITDLDPTQFADEPQIQRAIEVTRSGQRYVESKGIAEALKNWEFPLYFFDFETIMPALPRYEGTHSYTQIPYQFSCHVLASPEAELKHFEYLHLETGDPRPGLVNALLQGFGDKGSVVSYYAKFEAARLKELASAFPEAEKTIMSIVERLVDPLPLVREFIYDREFRGSFSIKSVAPALLGEEFRYDDKDVSNGQIAGVWADKYLRGIGRASELIEVKQKLLQYCRQDTLAMVRLWEWLKKA